MRGLALSPHILSLLNKDGLKAVSNAWRVGDRAQGHFEQRPIIKVVRNGFLLWRGHWSQLLKWHDCVKWVLITGFYLFYIKELLKSSCVVFNWKASFDDPMCLWEMLWQSRRGGADLYYMTTLCSGTATQPSLGCFNVSGSVRIQTHNLFFWDD